MNQIAAFFKKEGLPLAGQTVVAAVSGGPDSMALLALLQETEAEIIVAHVDHRLRPDSHKEAELLEQYCNEHSLTFENYVWQSPASVGIEAAARKVRYAFFKKLVEKYGARYVATAHQADDVLENVLLKLIRSGAPFEMASLKPVEHRASYTLVRPLLNCSKQELADYDAAHGISYIRDATNAEDGTVRNRLRHHVVPLLKKENPELLAHANRFCQSMGELESEQSELFASYPEASYFAPGIFSFETSLTGHKLSSFLAWQTFQLWGVRVHFNDQGQTRGFYFLTKPHRVFLINKKELAAPNAGAIKVDKPFSFNGKKYVLRTDKTALEVAHFYAASDASLRFGGLPAGSRLALASGQHAKAKKFLAQAHLPSKLSRYCLTIFAQDDPVLVLGAYQNQLFSQAFVRYSLQALVE